MPGIHFYVEHISNHGFVTHARAYIIIFVADAIDMSLMWRNFIVNAKNIILLGRMYNYRNTLYILMRKWCFLRG